MGDHDVRYPPIADYGLLGDLRSAALLSKDGSIDWMCLPRFDSPWVFGRLLDWDKGGYLDLGLVDGAVDYRQYRRDSNVIQTIWSSGRARMRVVDWMPIAPKSTRLKPPESLRLIRMMQPVAGATDWQLTFKPRFDYGRQVPLLTPIRSGMLVAEGADGNVFLQYPEGAALALADGVATVRGRVMLGHRATVLLHYADSDRKPPAPVSVDEAHTYLHQTDDYWVNWLRSSTYRGRFEEPLHRSALALKLMQYLPTGAFVAAPTTSLPESLGGSLNWDYRYTWIRDSSDLVNALHQLGFEDEVDGFLRWVRAAHDRHPGRFQIMYTIDGEDRLPEFVLDDLEGYRGSKPVRIGNAAVEQVQLDIYGELIQTAYTAWQSRKELPRPRRAILLGVVDYILEHWQMEDSGMWESRRRPRRYLYSKVMLWVGLDRALRLDPALRMGKIRGAAVRRTRDAIKREVLELGYDQEVGAFTQALGHKDLDANALAVAMYEMLPATDPRVVSTVKVLQEKLSNNGFLYRYVPEESEFHQPEGVFIICTLWLVNVLAQMGRLEEAESLFSRVTEAANDLGLFAEEFDPDTGELLGNFPQALTHLSVINAALNLEGRPSGKGRRSGRRDGG
ncbi:MAG: glycoside hydrolase family 15 protein [Candidatus Dormibacteraeota bacterium]|nr:glycoside hydrolase family 15 protein [Candidatus Dormibacteraeota bacterium]